MISDSRLEPEELAQLESVFYILVWFMTRLHRAEQNKPLVPLIRGVSAVVRNHLPSRPTWSWLQVCFPSRVRRDSGCAQAEALTCWGHTCASVRSSVPCRGRAAAMRILQISRITCDRLLAANEAGWLRTLLLQLRAAVCSGF